MDRVCSRCGCSSFHYNRSRMRMECDSCGHPVYDPQQDQQLMQYDKTYSQAMSHLAAGNWEQTLVLLRPLMSQFPTEKKLYYAILRATTHDFEDIDMDNTANRTIASEAWDKLVRLHGVNAEMLIYAKKRYEKCKNQLHNKRNKLLARFFTGSVCSIFAGVFWSSDHKFISVVFMLATWVALSKALEFHPIEFINQFAEANNKYKHNPFV